MSIFSYLKFGPPEVGQQLEPSGFSLAYIFVDWHWVARRVPHHQVLPQRLQPGPGVPGGPHRGGFGSIPARSDWSVSPSPSLAACCSRPPLFSQGLHHIRNFGEKGYEMKRPKRPGRLGHGGGVVLGGWAVNSGSHHPSPSSSPPISSLGSCGCAHPRKNSPLASPPPVCCARVPCRVCHPRAAAHVVRGSAHRGRIPPPSCCPCPVGVGVLPRSVVCVGGPGWPGGNCPHLFACCHSPRGELFMVILHHFPTWMSKNGVAAAFQSQLSKLRAYGRFAPPTPSKSFSICRTVDGDLKIYPHKREMDSQWVKTFPIFFYMPNG